MDKMSDIEVHYNLIFTHIRMYICMDQKSQFKACVLLCICFGKCVSSAHGDIYAYLSMCVISFIAPSLVCCQLRLFDRRYCPGVRVDEPTSAETPIRYGCDSINLSCAFARANKAK